MQIDDHACLPISFARDRQSGGGKGKEFRKISVRRAMDGLEQVLARSSVDTGQAR